MTLLPLSPSTSVPTGDVAPPYHEDGSPSTAASSNVDVDDGLNVSDPLGLLAKSSHIAAAAAAADAVNNERKRRMAHKTEDQRREERLAANRRSAAESRKRKKAVLEELKDNLTKLSKENRQLAKDNQDLRRMLELKEKKRATEEHRQLREQLELEYLSRQQLQQQHASFRFGTVGLPAGDVSSATMPFSPGHGPEIVHSIARATRTPVLHQGSCGGRAGQPLLYYGLVPEKVRPVTSLVGRPHPATNSFFS